MKNLRDDHYSERETQRRFKALVQTALNTPPKPQKSMASKGVPAQSKKRRKKVKASA